MAEFMLQEFLHTPAAREATSEPTSVDGHPSLLFRAPALALGQAVVEFEDTEITVYFGQHTHEHFGVYLCTSDDPYERARMVVAMAQEQVMHLFSDQLAVWSRGSAGRASAGGTFRVNRPPRAWQRIRATMLRGVGGTVLLWSGADL